MGGLDGIEIPVPGILVFEALDFLFGVVCCSQCGYMYNSTILCKFFYDLHPILPGTLCYRAIELQLIQVRPILYCVCNFLCVPLHFQSVGNVFWLVLVVFHLFLGIQMIVLFVFSDISSLTHPL